jgi:hypothetical protein
VMKDKTRHVNDGFVFHGGDEGQNSA